MIWQRCWAHRWPASETEVKWESATCPRSLSLVLCLHYAFHRQLLLSTRTTARCTPRNNHKKTCWFGSKEMQSCTKQDWRNAMICVGQEKCTAHQTSYFHWQCYHLHIDIFSLTILVAMFSLSAWTCQDFALAPSPNTNNYNNNNNNNNNDNSLVAPISKSSFEENCLVGLQVFKIHPLSLAFMCSACSTCGILCLMYQLARTWSANARL